MVRLKAGTQQIASRKPLVNWRYERGECLLPRALVCVFACDPWKVWRKNVELRVEVWQRCASIAMKGNQLAPPSIHHQHKCLRNELALPCNTDVSVFNLEWGELACLRIVSSGETEQKSPLSGFFEKDFYRQKGACVKSGGIFIDLSGVLRFSFGFIVYSW